MFGHAEVVVRLRDGGTKAVMFVLLPCGCVFAMHDEVIGAAILVSAHAQLVRAFDGKGAAIRMLVRGAPDAIGFSHFKIS